MNAGDVWGRQIINKLYLPADSQSGGEFARGMLVGDGRESDGRAGAGAGAERQTAPGSGRQQRRRTDRRRRRFCRVSTGSAKNGAPRQALIYRRWPG